MKKFISAIVVIIVIGGAMMLWSGGASTSPTATTTPTEGKPTPTGQTAIMESAQLDGVAQAGGVTVKPLSVLEDSRCPTDVVCIQAGTVRLSVEIGGIITTTTKELKLGDDPITVSGWNIKLVRVTPDSVSTKQIALTDYTFYFTITKVGAPTGTL